MAKRDKKARQEKRAASIKRTKRSASEAKAASGKTVKPASKGTKPSKKPAGDTVSSAGEMPRIDAAVVEGESAALARISQLEADRTNLMAQVAWARAVAQEQQKSLEFERERSGQLAAELDAQRARIEQLKSLSLLDRLLGRHKGI